MRSATMACSTQPTAAMAMATRRAFTLPVTLALASPVRAATPSATSTAMGTSTMKKYRPWNPSRPDPRKYPAQLVRNTWVTCTAHSAASMVGITLPLPRRQAAARPTTMSAMVATDNPMVTTSGSDTPVRRPGWPQKLTLSRVGQVVANSPRDVATSSRTSRRYADGCSLPWRTRFVSCHDAPTREIPTAMATVVTCRRTGAPARHAHHTGNATATSIHGMTGMAVDFVATATAVHPAAIRAQRRWCPRPKNTTVAAMPALAMSTTSESLLITEPRKLCMGTMNTKAAATAAARRRSPAARAAADATSGNRPDNTTDCHRYSNDWRSHDQMSAGTSPAATPVTALVAT